MQQARVEQTARGGAERSVDDRQAALDRCILCTLSLNDRDMLAKELAEHLGTRQRIVVGRLQSLKRHRAVAYKREGSAPSAPGLWAITERGRREIGLNIG